MLEIFKKFTKKNYIEYCPFAFDSIIFTQDNKVSLCRNNNFIAEDSFNEVWLDTSKITALRNKLKMDFIENNIPEKCLNCCYKVKGEITNNPIIRELIFSHWKCCYYRCVNCRREIIPDIAGTKHIYVMPVLKQLIQEKVIDKSTKIIIDCGEALLHPEFEKLFMYINAYEFDKITIHTNAHIFSKEIADSIAQGRTELIIDIDTTGESIYKKIKGVNRYGEVVQNIEHYKRYEQPSNTNIILKYTMINGITDNQQGIADFYIYGKEIGIKKFIVDIEDNWYNDQIKPEHFDSNLKKLIEYTIQLSKINNNEIELSPKLNHLNEIRMTTSFYRNR